MATPPTRNGLPNMGNTCFANAAVQALASLNAVGQFADSAAALVHDTHKKTSPMVQLCNLLTSLATPRGRQQPPVSPSALFNTLDLPFGALDGKQGQHDAGEFCNELIEQIHAQFLFTIGVETKIHVSSSINPV
jgi:ubiquitin C-terminal hydrolase